MTPETPRATPRIAIVGGGVSGLATALQILDQGRAAGLDPAITIFERETVPGGHLRTLRAEGFQLEWGPNGFLDNEPATLRLVDRLGLRDQLLCSSDAARHRFLLIKGKLCELPMSPPAFIRSPMLSPAAKLRMACEIVIPRRVGLGLAAEDPQYDETIYDFGVRRLGRDFAETMLDPMVKGIFGGDARNLSLAAAFPRMVEMEQQYGSLFKAMIAISRQKKKLADAGPSGVLHSFVGGMAVLPDRLAALLGADERVEIRTNAGVEHIEKAGTGDGSGAWRLIDQQGEVRAFDAVVNCAPAHAAAKQLKGTVFADLLAQIPYVPMAVITLAFARESVEHDLNGFGMLIPSFENRDLLGVLWTSSIFSGRAPDGRVLLRCMAGGPSHADILENDDTALLNMTLGEIRPLFGIHGQPLHHWVIRHPRAIAQYVPGHPARMKRVDAALAADPGLYLTGSAYKGISVNYCVKEAEITAERVVADLGAAVAAAV